MYLNKPSARDRYWMQRAIQLATRADPSTVSPNPRVRALILERGHIVAEGFHAYDGGPHAERIALEKLGRLPRIGAELFVTLEPCSTAGRTGSCCQRIIDSCGIRRVVVGCLDPNPAHAGRAIELLKSHGIEAIFGVEDRLCTALNPEFNQRMRILADNLGTGRRLPSNE